MFRPICRRFCLVTCSPDLISVPPRECPNISFHMSRPPHSEALPTHISLPYHLIRCCLSSVVETASLDKPRMNQSVCVFVKLSCEYTDDMVTVCVMGECEEWVMVQWCRWLNPSFLCPHWTYRLTALMVFCVVHKPMVHISQTSGGSNYSHCGH